jgi:hypothetical protein
MQPLGFTDYQRNIHVVTNRDAENTAIDYFKAAPRSTYILYGRVFST